VVDTPVSTASSAEIALAKPPAIVESAPVTTDSTTTSEKIPMQKIDAKNTMQYGERLKNKAYADQVRNVLGTTETDPKKLRDIIGTLQDKLEVKKDRALGPNTFDKLKVRWDAFTKDSPDGKYKDFIDGLIRPNAEKPATVTKPPESSITLDIQTPQAEAISPKMEENTKELRQDMESGMLRVGDEKINFELK
jgi:hypothetical protein